MASVYKRKTCQPGVQCSEWLTHRTRRLSLRRYSYTVGSVSRVLSISIYTTDRRWNRDVIVLQRMTLEGVGVNLTLLRSHTSRYLCDYLLNPLNNLQFTCHYFFTIIFWHIFKPLKLSNAFLYHSSSMRGLCHPQRVWETIRKIYKFNYRLCSYKS